MTCRSCGARAPRFLECDGCGDPVCPGCRFEGRRRLCPGCAELAGREQDRAGEAEEEKEMHAEGE